MALEMEEIGGRASSDEIRFSPNTLAGTYRNRFGAQRVASSCCLSTVGTLESALFDVSEESCIDESEINFVPVLRSGGWSDIGFRCNMEDAHVRIDDLFHNYGVSRNGVAGSYAFYGVFDGHGGEHAAIFTSINLPKFISKDEDFPVDVEKAIVSSFLKTDIAFAEACSLDSSLDSGTTALAALVIGRTLVVANTGDCRAVLSRKGKAFEMSTDHKPDCCNELNRIKASGGFIDDGGYLNGHLNVTRAIGDWHMEGLKDTNGKGPLIADPELKSVKLTKDDEFLIIGCDGIWDVFRSQNAVDIARRKLQEHNDPIACCKELVDEALRRQSTDNLSVVIVCFQSKPPPSLSRPRPPPVRKSISLEGLNVLKSFLNDSSPL